MADQQHGSDTPPRRGFFANVGALVFARGFLAVSQVLVLPIIARHLEVEEFAVMALAMTVVIFTSVLSDAGLGRSLIRSRDYDPAEWSSVFWLLVGVGLLLCLAVLAIAPVWAWVFEQPALLPILAALSVVPLFQALSAAPNAEIERREHYTALARLQIAAAAAGLVVAVILAMAGAGVWALVAQQVILAGVRLAGIVALSRFRPSLVFVRGLIGGHLTFARDAIVVSLISTLKSQSSILAIGKILGEGALGYFAMSQRFTRLPQFGLAGPMSSVVFVRMAKAQDDPEALARIYLASSRLLATILFPPLAMIAVAGTAIFTVLLSEKWAPVASVFALSIPGVVLEAVTVTYLACLFRAIGRTDLHVRLMIEGAVLSLILVVSAAFVSLEAVAGSLTIWSLLYVPRGWSLVRRAVPLPLKNSVTAILPAAAVSAFFVLAHLTARHLWVFSWPSETALAMVLALVAIAGLFLFDRRLREAIVALQR